MVSFSCHTGCMETLRHSEQTEPTVQERQLENSTSDIRAVIYETLRNGAITRLTEPVVAIDESQNIVEQVAIEPKISEAHTNSLQLVMVGDAESPSLLGLYKPLTGENKEARLATNIPNMMNRELLTNLISERILGYSVTPPIAARNIDGEPGTVQQFYSREHYATPETLLAVLSDDEFERCYDRAMTSDDAKRIALMDFVLGSGSDRHMANFLIRHSEDESLSPIVAIDNAIALTTHAGLLQHYQVQGPLFEFTAQNTQYGTIAKNENTPIPDHLLSELTDALEHWDTELASGDFQFLLDTELVRFSEAASENLTSSVSSKN
jgi:hypothetical protein